jgi:hypothetical protein
MNQIYNTSIDKVLYAQGAYGVHEELDYHINDIDDIDFINEYGNRILINNVNEDKVRSWFFRLVSFVGIFITSVVSIVIIGNVL